MIAVGFAVVNLLLAIRNIPETLNKERIVELKRIKIIDEEIGEGIKEKDDMDVELTIDAMHHLEKYSTAILFTGDSDFLGLVSYLRNKNKKVYIFSSKNNISKELRTSGDGYCDVLHIKGIWGKDLKSRKK